MHKNTIKQSVIIFNRERTNFYLSSVSLMVFIELLIYINFCNLTITIRGINFYSNTCNTYHTSHSHYDFYLFLSLISIKKELQSNYLSKLLITNQITAYIIIVSYYSYFLYQFLSFRLLFFLFLSSCFPISSISSQLFLSLSHLLSLLYLLIFLSNPHDLYYKCTVVPEKGKFY